VSPPTDPTVPQLVNLFEDVRRGCPEARQALERWFRRACGGMAEGRRLRDELEAVTYQAAERDAARQCRPGGAYPRLRSDPGSVAFRHLERFQPFCRQVEQGEPKTLDQYLAWVRDLTRLVLTDLQAEQDERDRVLPNGIPDAGIPHPDADDPPSPEEVRALLARAYRELTPEQFIIVVLSRR